MSEIDQTHKVKLRYVMYTILVSSRHVSHICHKHELKLIIYLKMKKGGEVRQREREGLGRFKTNKQTYYVPLPILQDDCVVHVLQTHIYE